MALDMGYYSCHLDIGFNGSYGNGLTNDKAC